MNPSSSNNIRVAKIYFLKEKNRTPLSRDKEMVQLSAVHLSSIIQTQKKEAVNQQMMELAKKINEASPFRPFLLSQSPKSQQSSYYHNVKSVERNLYSSVGIKTKKLLDPSSIYLSDIADEKWSGSPQKETQQALNKYERSKSSKKNYKMRKYEFKTFLKERQVKLPIANDKQIKQVIYEKQEANKWGQVSLVIHSSRASKIAARRKHLQAELQVLGNSFRVKKQSSRIQQPS